MASALLWGKGFLVCSNTCLWYFEALYSLFARVFWVVDAFFRLGICFLHMHINMRE